MPMFMMAIGGMPDPIRHHSMHPLHTSVTMASMHMFLTIMMFIFLMMMIWEMISRNFLAVLDSQVCMTWISGPFIDVMNEVILGHYSVFAGS